MRRAAIINTRSYRKAGRRGERILAALRALAGDAVYFTGHYRHAEELARGVSDCDQIIAVGGDGTIAEVVNAMDRERQTLAVVPLGTGNSLVRDLGLRSAVAALGAIATGKTISVDLITCRFRQGDRWTKRHAVATTGFGFIADTVIVANQHLKWSGRFCYPLATVAALFRQKHIPAMLRIGETAARQVDITNVAINNTAHGGNFRIFPGASAVDGYFDLLVARLHPMTQCIFNLGLLTRTYWIYPGIRAAERDLHCLLPRPVPFMIDGEIVDGVEELLCAVAPGALRIVVGVGGGDTRETL